MTLTIRCEHCGKVLKGKDLKEQTAGTCPRCGEGFEIPQPLAEENRKSERHHIAESRLFQPIPEPLTEQSEAPFVRAVYTEAPPAEFALQRTRQIPVLDVSEGGMGLLMRSDEVAGRINPGDTFVVEIDSPIYVKPLSVQVRVCWMRQIKRDRLHHVGVQFCSDHESFKEVIQNLITYIKSRTETIDSDIWGSFG